MGDPYYYFLEPAASNVSGNRRPRREPNMFITFRKEMMNHRPRNMPMKSYSKWIAIQWKNLPNDVKDQLQRKYQIKRDKRQKSRSAKRKKPSKIKQNGYLTESASTDF